MLDSDSIVNDSIQFGRELRKKRLFQACVASEVALIFALISYYFFIPEQNVILIPLASVAILVGGIFVLIKFDKVELGIGIFLLFMLFTMTYFMWAFEGTKDETMLIYPAIILFAIILGNKYLALFLFGLIVLNILGIGYLNSEGIISTQVAPPQLTTAIFATIIVSLVSYSLWLVSSDVRLLLEAISKENRRVAESKAEIQELLKNEKRLRKHEIEVHKLQKLENIGTLAGGIAHDFNNMLTSILGNISLAKLKLDDKHPSKDYLHRSEQSIERAAELARQLITFSKGEQPNKKILDFIPIIQDTVQFDLSGSNVKASYEFEHDTAIVEIDRGQIQQVISNITINAVQAMSNGGRLHIHTGIAHPEDIAKYHPEASEYLKIQFIDEGEGMEQESLEKMFDLYFTTKGSGNGLGMSIVYSIIKKT